MEDARDGGTGRWLMRRPLSGTRDKTVFSDPPILNRDAVRARFGTQIRQFGAAVRHMLGVSAAERRDVDFEQSVLRTTFAGGLIVYIAYLAGSEPGGLTPALRLGLLLSVLVEAAGLWMMSWFKRHSERPAKMRFFGIAVDILPLTIGVWGNGEYGAPLVGIYLWIIVGNGLRFGRRYLHFAYWLSLGCFAAQLWFVPFWQLHPRMGIGFFLGLFLTPLYVLLLLSRETAQKNAALELSNAKSRFVANVSHELRTPLTGVFAVYELLRRRAATPDDRELIGSLGSAIATLRASVDAVLQMSKLEAGAERARMRLFNLRYFLQQMAALARPQAMAKGLAWQLDVDSAVPGTVVGDPNHLQHVLGNLLNNAFKFTTRGSVTLRVTRVEGGVRFEVADTGIGIARDKQEALFERFVQADSSATRKYGGTGLGASIAHDLVKLMGGTIGVSSALGQGSTFRVELPLGEQGQVNAPVDWGSRREVLVIGPTSSTRDELTAIIAGLSLKPALVMPSLDAPPSFAFQRYLAALLVLPAAEATIYADHVLRDRAGIVCPWLVVAPRCTPTQASTLLKCGAAALLQPDLKTENWQRHLAAFTACIDMPSEEQLPRALRPLNVLLADDNHSNRLLLARILGDAGHTVFMVSRGDEAFDRMAAGDLDLAILDLNMPEMSGPDVTKLFRAGEAGGKQKLPILILSADATEAAKEESFAAGANEYVVKPVTSSTLLAAIERIAAGTAARQGSLPPARAAIPLGLAPDVARASVHLVSRPAASASTLVDPERVEALRRIARGDHSFLTKYSEAVFSDLEAAISELRGALQRGDAVTARGALHKIDGTGASIGAVALIASSKNMRNYLTGGFDSDAQAALAEAATTCALTKSALAALVHPATNVGRSE